MNKKGFTLVELMVVIVIIGVLAAVAIPKMMAATNKAKAGEGPQILRSIASMEATYKAENDTYINANSVNGNIATAATPADGWYELGFDQQPKSRYFSFVVSGGASPNADNSYAVADLKNTFLATAELTAGLGAASVGAKITIDEGDNRKNDGTNSGKELGKLVPNWK